MCFFAIWCSYSREIPTRFQKQLLQPYLDAGGETVHVAALNRMLTNIGHSQELLTVEEQQQLLRELDGSYDGHGEPIISTKRIVKLIQ